MAVSDQPSVCSLDVRSGAVTSESSNGPTDGPLLCSYRNSTDRMAIVRARGAEHYFLERVVFPFELMTFHCPKGCEVEVITRTPAGLEESEWVSAEELVAGEKGGMSEQDWLPLRSIRKVNIRSNGSSVHLNLP